MSYPERPMHSPVPGLSEPPSPGQSLSAEQKERLLSFVADHYVRGYSIREIADLISRSHTIVRRLLDEAGIQRRPPGAPPIRPRRPSD